MTIQNKRRLLSIGIGGLMALFLVILTLWFSNPSFQAILAASIFVKQGTYPLLLFLFSWLVFSLATYAYTKIDFRLPGSRGFKTTLFVISELLIVLLYVSEPLPHRIDLDWVLNPLKVILLFLFQAKCIQYFLAEERLMYRPKPFFYTRGLSIYMFSFTAFRLVTYVGLDGYQLPDGQIGASLSWSLAMGFAIGLAFSSVQRYLIRQDKKGKTLLFTFYFFAVFSIGYHTYLGLTYQIAWFDLFSRCSLDIIAVALATWIVLYFQIDARSELRSRPLDEGI